MTSISEPYRGRIEKLRNSMDDESIDMVMIADPDALYYFCGLYNCLHMEFGRPTVLVVSRDRDNILVTPQIEYDMAQVMTGLQDIRAWQDGIGSEWRGPLLDALGAGGNPRIGIEAASLPPVIRRAVEEGKPGAALKDASHIFAKLRRIKTAEEIAIARHAGQMATAMMQAAHAAISEGVPEYEISLAATNAGTRKAAQILDQHYAGSMMSPNVHFLQIMASGARITLCHHRASTKKVESGDPVFLCFCGMTNFHQFKLGFDRTFWLHEIRNPIEAEMYMVAIESQAAALAAIRPGVRASRVHEAYADVIQSAGYDFPFRAGRATGFSFLETPQLAAGDDSIIEENMIFAVDGSVQKPGIFRAQVGDSIRVTADGYEMLTHFPKGLAEAVIC